MDTPAATHALKVTATMGVVGDIKTQSCSFSRDWRGGIGVIPVTGSSGPSTECLECSVITHPYKTFTGGRVGLRLGL